MAVGAINAAKDLSLAYQPLLLAEFEWPDGEVLRLSTHGLTAADGGVQYGGHDYLPRIVNQDVAATQILEQGVSMAPTVTLALNDGDRWLWTNYELTRGFRGARLRLRFVFWNVGTAEFSSDSLVPFVGICSAPAADETTLTIRATSLLSMEQTMLPSLRVQKTCPWIFPSTSAERQAAADDDNSWWYPCGYSPDATGPNARGNLDGQGQPYTTCARTKQDCEARGMYLRDSQNRQTGSFGGQQWDPPQSFRSRGYISGKWEEGFNTSNEAKYGDYVPLVYGTAWVDPIILNVLGDANSTRFEALLGYGEMEDVLRVVVNDVEVPAAATWRGQAVYITDPLFCWRPVNRGSRRGQPSMDAIYDGQGDPHGSLAVIECVVPRKLADSSAVPRVRVLVRGPRLRKYREIESITVASGTATVTFTSANNDVASNDANYEFEIIGSSQAALNGVWRGLTNWTYGPPGTVTFSAAGVPDGTYSGGLLRYRAYTENPVWILADVLSWAGWDYRDLDLSSFARAAAFCDETVTYTNQFGSSGSHARFACSTVLRQRRSAGEIARGICNAARLVLVPAPDGRLRALVKGTLAAQQPSAVAGSNDTTPRSSVTLAGSAAQGYVAYHFTPANIVRGSLRISQRSNADAPNRVSFTFQDADNNYAFDAINVVDSEAIARAGQEIAGGQTFEGIPNYDQARRVVATYLAEAFRGNPRNHPVGDAGGTMEIELETTFRIIHLSVGDIVALTWPHLGLENRLFRVQKIQPANNFETARVTLAWHSDAWYVDSFGQEDAPLYSAQRRNRLARPAYPPMVGVHRNHPNPDPLWDGGIRPDFGLISARDFTVETADQFLFRVFGRMPVTAFSTVRPPYQPVQGTTAPTGGSLPGGRVYYVALVAVDSNGRRSPHGGPTRVYVPQGTDTNTIIVSDLNWADGTVGYDLFVGTDPMVLICYGYHAGTPASITFGGPLHVTARRPVPDQELETLRIRAKRVPLPGVWQGEVTAIDGQTVTCSGADWEPNQWAGRIVSFIGRHYGQASHIEEPPLVHCLIAANSSDALTLDPSFGPTPASIGNPSDGDRVWLVIRTRASLYGQRTIGDAALAMTPDEHAGRIVRIVGGRGRGQWRRIHTHDGTTVTIEGRWEITPDETSIWWIEEGSWERVTDVPVGDVSEAEPPEYPEFICNVAGLERQAMMVMVTGVDGGGNESPEPLCAFTDCYLYNSTGVPPSAYQAALMLIVQGTLAIGSDLAPRAQLAETTKARAVKVELKQAPIGANLVAQLYVGSAPWVSVTVPAGQTSGQASQSAVDAAPAIPAGVNVRVDLTAVGTTFPGADMTVFIYV